MINNDSSPVQDVDRTTTSGVRSKSPTTAAAWGRGDCQTSPCQAPPCLSLVHLPLTSARLCRRRWVCCARMKSLILVGFLVVVFFLEWVKMYAQTSLAVVQPQYTHTYTHTCTFCLMARGKPLDFSIRFKPTSRESHSQILTGWASTQIRGGPEHSQTHIRIWPEWTRAACCAIS